MRIFRAIYTAYCLVVFAIFFLIFFIPLLIPIVFPKKFRLVGILNRWWGRLTFVLAGLPWSIEYRAKLNHNQQYIFCPNHFSYLDIPAMGLNHYNTIFVGKSAMERVPLFGFMYRHLHITVDREKLKSRYTSLIRAMKALDVGKSLVIFPEGGMITHLPPQMARFKDGAFRASIEKQIPIVPVTIPHNWIILPDEKYMMIRWRTIKLIFHEPISPKGLTLQDVDTLKEKVRSVIEAELKKYFPHEH